MKITKVYLKETLLRLAKQVVFNLSGTLVDMFVLWICSDYLLNGYAGEYLLSPFISFECACATNFAMSSHFVWGDRMKGCNKRVGSDVIWDTIFHAQEYSSSKWDSCFLPACLQRRTCSCAI